MQTVIFLVDFNKSYKIHLAKILSSLCKKFSKISSAFCFWCENNKMAQRHSINIKRDRNMFKWIFFLFACSGICDNCNSKSKGKITLLRIFNKCRIVFNIIMYMYFCWSTLSYVLNTKEVYLKTIITNFLLNSVCIVNHLYLCRNFKKLKYLLKIVVQHASSRFHRQFVKILILVWILATNSFLFCMFFYQFNTSHGEDSFCFGFKCENIYLKKVFIAVYLYNVFIFSYMPINTFSTYYIVLCYEIKNMINAFKIHFKTEIPINYGKLSEIYSRIRSKISIIDSEVGVIVFYSFIFNAVAMYDVLSTIIHSTHKHSIAYMINIMFCAITLVIFAAELYFASSVHNASLSVKHKITLIKENDPQLISSYSSFIQIHQEEICMTVWGIVSITKSFIFGTFGTILTYCLLFDGMKTN